MPRPYHSITDVNAPRTWVPEDWCPRDEIMNEVLQILIDNDGPLAQYHVVAKLQALHPEHARGTCAAHTSASLLYFHAAKWIEPVGKERNSTIWKVSD